jgi:hypothetical protein
VPTNSLPLSAVVAAVCFTNSLPSLLTLYLPQTFTVTGSPATTAPPLTTPTTASSTTSVPPLQTPTTTRHDDRRPPVTHPTKGTVPHHNPGSTLPDITTSPGTAPRSGGGTSGGGSKITSPGGATGHASSGSGTTRRPSGTPSTSKGSEKGIDASLQDPNLVASRSTSHEGDAPWTLWMIVLALLAGAGTAVWWWQRGTRPTDRSSGVQ